MNTQWLRYFAAAACAVFIAACATNDAPPCRRVSAAEFMRSHTFKGVASDQFIGTAKVDDGRPGKVFKTIWEPGLLNSWAVIWCPVDELPKEYLLTARAKPNR